MNVSASSLEALAAQVADLAEAVRQLQAGEAVTGAAFRAGFAAGQDDVRRSMGQSARTCAPRRPAAIRDGHLRALDGGAR